MKSQWEFVTEATERLEVPGGWIVKHLEPIYDPESGGTFPIEWRPTMVYVPDPNHAWDVQ